MYFNNNKKNIEILANLLRLIHQLSWHLPPAQIELLNLCYISTKVNQLKCAQN